MCSSDLAYGGRRLAVTGIVSGVDLDMFDAPVVRLRGTNEFQDVQASFGKEFANETARLNKGDEVTVVCGKLTEVIGTPMLGDCTF